MVVVIKTGLSSWGNFGLILRQINMCIYATLVFA